MAEILPIQLDLPLHYSGDGLKSFTVPLLDVNGSPAVATIGRVDIDLVTSNGIIGYSFSSVLGGDYQLTVLANNVIQFPEIKSWKIQSTVYSYDLKVTDNNGFVKTYYSGKWPVKQSISGTVAPITPAPTNTYPTSSNDTFIII
jgi:hypothetical protein